MRETFGQILRKLRIKNKLSIRRLAQIVGFSEVHVWDIEHDKRRPFSLTQIMTVRRQLGLCEDETAALVFLAAQHKRGLFVHANDFAKPLYVFRLISLLATREDIPDEFFTKVEALL